jgi:hypothetical protein
MLHNQFLPLLTSIYLGAIKRRAMSLNVQKLITKSNLILLNLKQNLMLIKHIHGEGVLVAFFLKFLSGDQ